MTLGSNFDISTDLLKQCGTIRCLLCMDVIFTLLITLSYDIEFGYIFGDFVGINFDLINFSKFSFQN